LSFDICYSQTFSEILYDAGTSIEIQSSADVCATNIIINGSYSGGGTICSGALPVTLLSFTAGAVNRNDVKLEWTTGVELNNSGFDIERQILSGTEGWFKIAFIQGNGTTNEPRSYSYVDKKLQTNTYKYRLKQIDYNGSFEYFDLNSEVIIGKPVETGITQNYPNPSNPRSKIEYQIASASKVSIIVYNIKGQEVAVLVNEIKEAGYFSAEFDGTNFASGVYFYRIIAGSYINTKRMILVK